MNLAAMKDAYNKNQRHDLAIIIKRKFTAEFAESMMRDLKHSGFDWVLGKFIWAYQSSMIFLIMKYFLFNIQWSIKNLDLNKKSDPDKKWSIPSTDYYKNLDKIILNLTYNNLKKLIQSIKFSYQLFS